MKRQPERCKQSILLALISLLATCSKPETFADLQALVANIRARPGAQIEPVPEFVTYERFDYSAAVLRSPFQRLADRENKAAVQLTHAIKPDLERVREPLESHPLSELAMVGTLSRSGAYQALIEDSQEAIHRVGVGNFMGRNHGQILGIDANQVFLVEIVAGVSGGWIERPQTLSLTRAVDARPTLRK